MNSHDKTRINGAGPQHISTMTDGLLYKTLLLAILIRQTVNGAGAEQ